MDHGSRRRHLLTLADLTDDELHHLVSRAVDHAAGLVKTARPLDGCVVGSYFRVTSTRTRTAFASAAIRLGAAVITYGPGDLQLNTGETVQDTGEVMSRMLDGLVVRTAGDPAELRMLAGQDRMSVVNAMSADEHPTQAISDLATIAQRLGKVDGVRFLYLGEGNNTASALTLALTRFDGVQLDLRTPPGFGVARDKFALAAAAAERHGARLDEQHDMGTLPPEVDVVYTTRWETTGTTKPDPRWRDVFAPFQVSRSLMERYPNAVFMHDLPAHRGQEVDADVLDGRSSIAFDQAENKLYGAMAVLDWCLGGTR
jgi:ornithine carbamoyltransferase